MIANQNYTIKSYFTNFTTKESYFNKKNTRHLQAQHCKYLVKSCIISN